MEVRMRKPLQDSVGTSTLQAISPLDFFGTNIVLRTAQCRCGLRPKARVVLFRPILRKVGALSDWYRRVHRWFGTKEENMWRQIRLWPLPARDALAIAFVVLAISCVAVPSIITRAEVRQNVQLIVSQPKGIATLLEMSTSVRSEDTYYAQYRGEEVTLDGGWFIADPEPGTLVEVVQDPEKPDHVTVVGSPQSWTASPWVTVLECVLGIGLAITAALYAGTQFLSERTDPLLDRVFDLVESIRRWFRRERGTRS